MRAKTIRAIEPNAGTKAKLEKQLDAFLTASANEVSKAIFAALINEGVLVEAPIELAQDAAPLGFELRASDLIGGRSFRVRAGTKPEKVEQVV